MQETILDRHQAASQEIRRRDLLPRWIKFFIWLFLILSFLAPISLIFGLLGSKVDLALYGLETITPLSFVGFLIISLYAYKGVVGFGLWTEKKWAVKAAIIDGIVGIGVCLFLMFLLPLISDLIIGFNTSFRLELLLLVPYVWKMMKIRKEWEVE